MTLTPTPTHVVLPGAVRDAMLVQLGAFPFAQVRWMVDALEKAMPVAVAPKEPATPGTSTDDS